MCLWVFVHQLVVQFGIGIAVLVRCFVDRKAIEHQITERLGDGFSRPPFASVVVYLLDSLLAELSLSLCARMRLFCHLLRSKDYFALLLGWWISPTLVKKY